MLLLNAACVILVAVSFSEFFARAPGLQHARTLLACVHLSAVLGALSGGCVADQPLRWIFRLIPGYSLGNGLNQIASLDILPLLAAVCYPDARSTRVYDALDSDVTGANIVYLALTAPFYLALTILIDIALTSPRVRGYLETPPAAVADAPVVDDIDVAAEQARVAAAMADPTSGGAGAIQVAGLRKVFRTLEGRPKVAVRGLSLGLDVGDVFGFLGVNGAGTQRGGGRLAFARAACIRDCVGRRPQARQRRCRC